MSFPKVTRRQTLKSQSGRLAAQFFKRLVGSGRLMDRTLTKHQKNAKTVEAPSALAKFFTPIQ